MQLLMEVYLSGKVHYKKYTSIVQYPSLCHIHGWELKQNP